MKKILAMIGIAMLMSGCITTGVDTTSIELLNTRLTNIEKAVKGRPQPKVVNPQDRGNLTESQKDFIKWTLEYLEGKK